MDGFPELAIGHAARVAGGQDVMGNGSGGGDSLRNDARAAAEQGFGGRAVPRRPRNPPQGLGVQAGELPPMGASPDGIAWHPEGPCSTEDVLGASQSAEPPSLEVCFRSVRSAMQFVGSRI